MLLPRHVTCQPDRPQWPKTRTTGPSHEETGAAGQVRATGAHGTIRRPIGCGTAASWSGESTITAAVGGEPQQLQLATAPDDDGMTLLVSTGSADYAVFWDGSAWTSSAMLSTTPDNLTEVNVAYEQQSGDAIVVYGHSSDEVYYRVWDGSSLNAETAIPVPSGTSTSNNSLWSATPTDGGSDRIVLGVTNGALDGWVASGTAPPGVTS